MIYCIWGEYINHYTTDEIIKKRKTIEATYHIIPTNFKFLLINEDWYTQIKVSKYAI
jgi:hypothetical protein